MFLHPFSISGYVGFLAGWLLVSHILAAVFVRYDPKFFRVSRDDGRREVDFRPLFVLVGPLLMPIIVMVAICMWALKPRHQNQNQMVEVPIEDRRQEARGDLG